MGVSCEKSFFHLSIADRCLSSRGSVASGLKARTIDSNDIGAAFIPIYQFVDCEVVFCKHKIEPIESKLYEFVKCLYYYSSIC